MNRTYLIAAIALSMAIPSVGLAQTQAATNNTKPKLEDFVKESQQITLALDQLNTCERRIPGLAFPIFASLWQLNDNAVFVFGEAANKPLKDAAKLPALACDSPQDNQQKLNSHRHAFEWLSRLEVARLVSLQGGWSSGIAEVQSMPAELEALRKQLGTNLSGVYGAAAVEAEVKKYQGETELELALMCEERKSLRTKSPRACPTLSAEIIKFRPQAKKRIENLELMAKRLSETYTTSFPENPLGEPFAYYNQSDFMLWSSRALAPCIKGQTVVYLKDPAAKREGLHYSLPKRVFGKGDIIGQVTVKPDNPKYPMSLAIITNKPNNNQASAATVSVVQYSEEYVKCSNQFPK